MTRNRSIYDGIFFDVLGKRTRVRGPIHTIKLLQLVIIPYNYVQSSTEEGCIAAFKETPVILPAPIRSYAPVSQAQDCRDP